MFYYCSDGSKFDSKIEGLLYSREKDLPLNFYYYDDVYEKVNWKIEPPNSLQYYYLEQAKRIRDTYDYVVLCYSGGYDSTNILETFYYNNIKLDKIVTVGAFSQDSQKGVDENHNGEIYHNVFPYINQLGLESITQVIDYTDYFENSKKLSILKYKTDWIHKTGGWFSPHNWFWYELEQHIVPWEYKDKKVGIIFGKDKPGLFSSDLYYSGKIGEQNGFYFSDTPCTSYGNITKFDNCERINFYWDPNYTEILIKQLHVLKRFYDIKKEYGYSLEKQIPTINNLTINDLVYDLKYKIKFKSPKSKTNIMSLRDNYLENKKNSEIYSYYKQGILKIKDLNVQGISSKFYYIT